jgi:DHA2 family multidrug resistance protein
LQGVGGGALLVTSQTIITESWPPEKRGMAQAFYGMGVIIGPTLGPPLGGYITEHFHWPLIFYINIPLGIIATLLTLQFVRSPKYAEKSSVSDIDWAGIGLLAVFVGSLQYVLEKGQEEDWFNSNLITLLTVISILGAFFFIWRETTFRNPVVHLKVLKNGNLRIGTILSFIMGFGLYGTTFIIPLYTQSILGWTPTQAGLLFVPAALTTAFMMPFIGRILNTGIKHQYLVAGGMLLFFFFCMWGYKILTPDTGKPEFFWMLILRGVAMALLFIPITALSLGTLKGREIGEGAAFTGMMRQLGGSFGVALIITYMSRKNVSHKADLISHLDATNPYVQNQVAIRQGGLIAKGHDILSAKQQALMSIDYSVTKQAAVLSYMDVFLFCGALFLICIPFIIMAKGKKAVKVDMGDVH